MHKYYSTIIILIFISSFLQLFLPIGQCEETNGDRINVSTSYNNDYIKIDYIKIQDAINDANPGDTIFVYNGTYYENIVINKSIILNGEDRNNTIIDGNQLGNTIYITTDDATVSNFTIQNSENIFPKAGINISSNYNMITNNTIINNFYGMTMYNAKHNVILGNHISNNDHCGIYMGISSNNEITKNTIRNHQFNGIGIYDSSNANTIVNNTFIKNNFCGINIRISSNNIITSNTIMDNNIGIHIPQDKYGNIISNNFFSNNNIDIEKDSGFPILELIITIIVLVILTGFILFWREKTQIKDSISKKEKHILDARGRPCPIPLIMAKKKISKMKKGEVLEIITDDFVAKENLERFGKEKHKLIRINKDGNVFRIHIKK